MKKKFPEIRIACARQKKHVYAYYNDQQIPQKNDRQRLPYDINIRPTISLFPAARQNTEKVWFCYVVLFVNV